MLLASVVYAPQERVGGTPRGYHRAPAGLVLLEAMRVYYDYTLIAACTTCDGSMVAFDFGISYALRRYIR